MIAELVVVAADRAQAVGIDDLPAHARLAAAPAPGQSARRMARCRDRRQHRVADPHLLAVADHPVDMGRGEGRVHARLRVVGARIAAVEHGRGGLRGDELRAGKALQLGEATDMVEMLVAVEQIFDVRRCEAELADVVGDQRGAFLRAAVDQDVSRRIGDQDRRDAASADQIGVAENADGRRRLVPVVPVLASAGPQRPCDLDRRARPLDLLRLAEGNHDRQDLRGRGSDEANEHSSRRWRR